MEKSAALSALGDRGSLALDVGADGGEHVRQVREENPVPQRRARQPGQRAGPAAELEGRQGLLLLPSCTARGECGDEAVDSSGASGLPEP